MPTLHWSFDWRPYKVTLTDAKRFQLMITARKDSYFIKTDCLHCLTSFLNVSTHEYGMSILVSAQMRSSLNKYADKPFTTNDDQPFKFAGWLTSILSMWVSWHLIHVKMTSELTWIIRTLSAGWPHKAAPQQADAYMWVRSRLRHFLCWIRPKEEVTKSYHPGPYKWCHSCEDIPLQQVIFNHFNTNYKKFLDVVDK